MYVCSVANGLLQGERQTSTQMSETGINANHILITQKAVLKGEANLTRAWTNRHSLSSSVIRIIIQSTDSEMKPSFFDPESCPEQAGIGGPNS